MLDVLGDIFEEPANFLREDGSLKVDVLEQDEELASGQFVRVLALFRLFLDVLGYERLQLFDCVDLQ
jgi:hypothetical protein